MRNFVMTQEKLQGLVIVLIIVLTATFNMLFV